MISRIKGVLEIEKKLGAIQDSVSKLSDGVSAQRKELSVFSDDLKEMKKELRQFNSEAGKFSSSMSGSCEILASSNEGMKKELYEFKMLKSEIQSKLVSELTGAFRDKLQEETRKLDVDVNRFNELKDELSSLVGKFQSVESEISKFKTIASQVKTADFELSKHAKELTKADGEKLQLMQKIDHLERLCAKMRRRH